MTPSMVTAFGGLPNKALAAGVGGLAPNPTDAPSLPQPSTPFAHRVLYPASNVAVQP